MMLGRIIDWADDQTLLLPLRLAEARSRRERIAARVRAAIGFAIMLPCGLLALGALGLPVAVALAIIGGSR